MIRIIPQSEIQSALSKRKVLSQDIYPLVFKIVNDVKDHGDRSLFKFIKQYDHKSSGSFIVEKKVMDQSMKQISSDVEQALIFAIERVTAFHEQEKSHISSWIKKDVSNVTYGELFSPIDSVGLYVPGGSASYPSSVIMNAVPAIVAGVHDIYIATPSDDRHIYAAARMLGIKKIYRMGGAHAVSALAYGTESVGKVDKIVGPGNRYVTLAKKLVYGDVGIDTIAGPSEVVVIADHTANPAFIAMDLMAQAEHDEHAMSVLITFKKSYVNDVNEKINQNINTLNRRRIIKKSLDKYGFAVIARDAKHAMDIANAIAPEHLELAVGSPKSYLKYLKHAGAVFIGSFTPEVLGDYVAGPDHVLPTMGTARFSSGLGVHDFMKRTTMLEVKKDSFGFLGTHAIILGTMEGLDAHAMAVKIRL